MKAPNSSLLSVITSCIAAVPAWSSAPAGRRESDSAPPLTSLVSPARTQAPKASQRRSMASPFAPYLVSITMTGPHAVSRMLPIA